MSMDRVSTFVFDLDGTLVDSDGFDAELYATAVREVVGDDVEIDRSWQTYRQVTDAGVLAQILEELHVADGERVAARVRERFGSMVRGYLARGGACPAVPGAAEALEALRRRGCNVGIATGGWGHTARMKLERAGILIDGLAMASSDDSSNRVQIMKRCLDRLGGDPARTVYVGDGPWDLDASRKTGWAFIGVGEKLRGRCEHWIADFTDRAWHLYRDAYSPEHGHIPSTDVR